MKKYLLVALLFAIPSFILAIDTDVWISSNTATADTTQPLCTQYVVGTSTVAMRAVVHAVVVSSPTLGGGGVTLYNSSWTTTSQTIGPITTGGLTNTTVSPYYYDVSFPGGLMYTKTGTANVQILYQCY